MSLPRAPIALRMPISRVRSRTETSMMFMIPMPPTMSEIEAMPPSSTVSSPVTDENVESSCAWLGDREVVVGAVGPVALLEQHGHLGLGRVDLVGRGDAHADGADLVAAHEVVLGRGDRDQDLVVLADDPRGALGLHDPDHPERDAADLDRRPDARRVEAEVVRRRGAEHGDAQALVDRRLVEERALPHRVGAHVEVRRRRADDRRGRVLDARRSRPSGVDSSGSTAATPGTALIAVASSIVSVVADPAAPRVKPVRVAPGVTVSRLVPRPWIRSVMPLVAPSATATRATIDPTPMMTPSMVSTARSRLVPSRDRARRMSSKALTGRATRRGRAPGAARARRRPRRG